MSKPLEVTVAGSVRKQIYLYLCSSPNHHKYLSCYVKICWLFEPYKINPSFTDIPGQNSAHLSGARISPGISVCNTGWPCKYLPTMEVALTFELWRISPPHAEVTVPSGPLHLAAGDSGLSVLSQHAQS